MSGEVQGEIKKGKISSKALVEEHEKDHIDDNPRIYNSLKENMNEDNEDTLKIFLGKKGTFTCGESLANRWAWWGIFPT